MPIVSVLMPTFKQASFIRRAIDSLLAQSFTDWELWVIDDASPDETAQVVQPYLEHPQAAGRIHYQRLESNQGLGAALNWGLDHSQAPLVAYLPSDDVYYEEHLASLVECLQSDDEAVLAFSGVRYNYNRYSEQQAPDHSLQLVQVLHRRTGERWLERSELESDDLGRLYWNKLEPYGTFLSTAQISCEWVAHPHQRHKILREPVGGINTYRDYYGVKTPLRFHTTVGNFMDEVQHFRRFRERPDTPKAVDGLKILLVGELAYNADRVLALEERGHQLYGLWMPEPYWYNYVGPLPFGHVQDLDRNNWQEEIRRIQPDVIYALLNWQAVPFVHEVLTHNPGIPFVWHYKEGPFISLEKGHWSMLMDIYRQSDGLIYSSPEMQTWFETILPGQLPSERLLVLDGDLPKWEWFKDVPRSPRIAAADGEYHTVVPGRPIGLHPHTVVELAEQGIHLHFYGDFTQGQWLEWIEKTRRMAPNHIHLHHQVDHDHWVEEFSQYDAGWLHYFKSENGGDIRRANWDDLNYPARISTLMVAGLPILQRANPGAIVATQNLAQTYGIGLMFDGMADLRAQLDDTARMQQMRAHIWQVREQFCFDGHVDRLVSFFRKVIAHKAA